MASPSEQRPYGNAFITLFSEPSSGVRVAVKDLIDVAGTVTTAGCEVIAGQAVAATRDAACLAGVRESGAVLVGKTNLHELAFGTTGINSWSGTPINPLGPGLIPGGSSCGNAVALALHVCDVAFGTDTGGSVRIPSACCGTMGLKTTYGRISMKGIRPLAPSLDVVGPMATTVSKLAQGMELLDPSFQLGPPAETKVAILRFGGVHPEVQTAVELLLDRAQFRVVKCDISEDEWEFAISATNDILWAEAAESNLALRLRWDELQNGANLETALEISRDERRMMVARRVGRTWRARLASVVSGVGLVASPTIEVLPPTLDEVGRRKIRLSRFTSPVNLSGLPAVVVPIPSAKGLPASLQLIGPAYGEDVLLASARLIERSCSAAVRPARGDGGGQ
jgi:amidase